MKFYRLPIEYRDFCANLLIPLAQCRNREFYAPWKCIDERYTPKPASALTARHTYEKCQYDEYASMVV
jgi:NADH dehydrogenase (ubiquinone) 1 beta subcomplex subunit 7